MRRIGNEKQRLRRTRDEKRRIRESKYLKPLKELPKTTKINLLVNVYENGNRNEELKFCLDNNKANEYIDNIIEVEGRPSFNEMFKLMIPGEINIIANSDIYFDDSIRFVENLGERECYALTRWEYNQGNIKEFEKFNGGMKAKHSQDAWVFRGQPKMIGEEVFLGIPGCDNKIAYWLATKYKVFNPSKTIKAIHVHKERKRNYNPHNGIKKYKPPYHFPEPC